MRRGETLEGRSAIHRASVRRLITLSRPRFWPYVVGPYAIGVVASGARFDLLLILLLGVYFTLPANLLIYGVNDLFDRPTDRLNPKKGSYEALLDPREDRSLVVAILVTNLPFLVLLPWLPAPAIGWLAVFLVLGVGYSMPPLRFKTRPGLDSLSNFLYAAPGLVGFTAFPAAGPAPLLIVAALLWCAAMHAYSAVPDIPADRAASIRTIATRLGARGTVALCLALWIVSGALLAPWLPVFAVAGVACYAILGAASLRALSPTPRGLSLFTLYRVFPLVNTTLGGVLFLSVHAYRWG